MLLLLFVVGILSQDPYVQFNFLQDFFSQSSETVYRDYCPFVTLNSSRGCPHPDYQEQIGCLEGENGHSTELITFDVVTREIRAPIIDMEASRVNVENYGNEMKVNYFPATFSKVEDYYDNFVSFEANKPFRNGMFQNVYDMIKFFSDNFGNGKNANLTISQKEYVVIRNSLDKDNIVLKKSVQDLIDVYLPTEYDEKSYAKFVKEYGSQVATSCNYGGLVEVQMFVKECLPRLLDQMRIDQLLSQEADRVSTDGTKREGDPDYIQKSQVKSTAIYGGDPLIEKFSERTPTFPGDPFVTSCEFIPLYEVIKNSEKRENLKNYLENYVKEPQRQREEIYKQILEEKEKQYLKEPMPIVLVSETNFYFKEMRIDPGQLAGPYTFQYEAAPTIPFYCECTPMKYCRCQTQSYPGTRGKYIREGISDLGIFTYSWKHCWRCGHCLWTHHCCCDHHSITTKTYGVIGCEKVFKDKKGDIECSCIGFS